MAKPNYQYEKRQRELEKKKKKEEKAMKKTSGPGTGAEQAEAPQDDAPAATPGEAAPEA